MMPHFLLLPITFTTITSPGKLENYQIQVT